MPTDKVSRLQTLLDRIKKNAASPRHPLGSNLVFGGTQAARNDISTGPSVPAASVTKPKDEPAFNNAATPRRPPLPPIAAAGVVPHQPEPAAAAAPRTPTLSGAARVPTMAGGPIGRPLVPVPEVAAKPPPQLEIIEELDFDDAVDITSDVPPPAEISSVGVSHTVSIEAEGEARAEQPSSVDIDDLHWSEPPTGERRPPDSSPRPRAAASLDEALAEATAGSVEPPITPPPESGRQPLEGVYAAPIPEPIRAPTVEQLGETLELEAPTSAALELDIVVPKVQKPKEELEFELPPRASALEPPAREEMPTLTQEADETKSRHRAPEQSQTQISKGPDDGDTIEMAAIVAPPEASAPSTDRDNLMLTPELTERTARARAATPEFIHAAHKFAPKSFAELLDASLKLG